MTIGERIEILNYFTLYQHLVFHIESLTSRLYFYLFFYFYRRYLSLFFVNSRINLIKMVVDGSNKITVGWFDGAPIPVGWSKKYGSTLTILFVQKKWTGQHRHIGHLMAKSNKGGHVRSPL